MPGSLVQEEKRLEVEAEPRKEVTESEGEEFGAAAAAAEDAAGGEGGAAAAAKKKKKKKKKSASAASAAKSLGFLPAQDNSALRCLGSWPEEKPSQQTVPPTKTMQQLFPSGDFPKGEIQLYASPPNGAEAREAERLAEVDIEGLREAAECHRQVRRYAQSLLRPGLSLTELCNKLEAKTEELIAAAGIERGKGFPTGCSLNECAAHYTPNPGEDRILGQGDICKLDFGVQVRGRIIDCAFSIAFDPKFDPLIQATKEATNAGLRAAGVDARLSELGCIIEETINSFEMQLDGQTVPIKPIRNLTGHSIAPYRIHAGKSVPIVGSSVHSSSLSNRIEEGEVYAVETFATTGKGSVQETADCSHYMKSFEAGFIPLRLKTTKDLLKLIDERFGTLAFCRRWLHAAGAVSHQMALQQLVKSGLIVPYPPLSDVFGSYTSQSEHTIFIGAKSTEILSRGPDF
ncbi:methionine aminopeptidase, type II, putative [Eimeria acervulina]|uniref:Methionine aminopeptidase 2 n=1 Tax=Eimeria acervulina TaxID=5801 RepID=U6GS18_EIMAC|nr:methionine aminopeptidase, type II, putative [Eimeria acervulina]CDI82377.1 methionine aminopeptidase, type II, putative [Eimeria acervulina]